MIGWVLDVILDVAITVCFALRGKSRIVATVDEEAFARSIVRGEARQIYIKAMLKGEQPLRIVAIKVSLDRGPKHEFPYPDLSGNDVVLTLEHDSRSVKFHYSEKYVQDIAREHNETLPATARFFISSDEKDFAAKGNLVIQSGF